MKENDAVKNISQAANVRARKVYGVAFISFFPISYIFLLSSVLVYGEFDI